MKVFLLAKELGVGCQEVMAAFEQLGLSKPNSNFATLTAEQVDPLRRHFLRQALNTGSESVDSASASSANLSSVEPPSKPTVIRRKPGEQKSGKDLSQKRLGKLEMPSALFGGSRVVKS